MTTSLRVLAYHRIATPESAPALSPSLISATPDQFDRTMRVLARSYRAVSMEQVMAAADGRRPLPPRAVLITFDDGYRDFAGVAWPILKRYGLPATLFVPTAFPGDPDREFWWDRLHRALAVTACRQLTLQGLPAIDLRSPERRRAAFRRLRRRAKNMPDDQAMALVDRICTELDPPARAPARAVLSWNELRRLAGDGVTIASHTRTHRALSAIPLDEVRDEVNGARKDLEQEIGSTLPVLAYPAGAYNAAVTRAVAEAGMRLAFTIDEGHNPMPARDPLRLRRINMTARGSAWGIRLRLTRPASSIAARWQPPPGGAADGGRPAAAAAGGSLGRVAYVMSRFPKLSETFVLHEILSLRKLDMDVIVMPLLRHHERVSHEAALAIAREARVHPFLSPAIMHANLHFFSRAPARYLAAWREVLSGTWGSWNFFVGAVGVFPKAVRFAYELSNEGVSHVHAHFANHPAVAALVVHRMTGIPFSFTAHGSDLHVDRHMLPQKVRAASFVVTVCEYNKRVIVAECGADVADKVHVVHCGVDVDGLPPRCAELRPHAALVCVASLEEVKGHATLIEACGLLRDRGVDFVCHLIGEGPLRRQLERDIARRKLTARVVLHGGRTHAEVVRMLAQSDIAVLASRPTKRGKREGVPVALMEAMAAGLPVVASDLSGIPELVEPGRTGFLVAPGDARGLADALARLARDPDLRARFGRAGRNKVARDFSQQASARTLLRLFAAAGRNRRARVS